MSLDSKKVAQEIFNESFLSFHSHPVKNHQDKIAKALLALFQSGHQNYPVIEDDLMSDAVKLGIRYGWALAMKYIAEVSDEMKSTKYENKNA